MKPVLVIILLATIATVLGARVVDWIGERGGERNTPTVHDMTKLSGEYSGLWFILDQPVQVREGDIIILHDSVPLFFDTVIATQDGWITHRGHYSRHGTSIHGRKKGE